MSKYCERMMGKRVGLLLLACAVLFGPGCAPSVSAHSRVSAGGDYYAEDFEFLAQYGEWMGVPPYGVVWSPYVDRSWAPFYDGRWLWTSDGWAWDSYEPFGDLVYHYGYWYYDNDIGWFWVPGDEWSPARVQWYNDGAYCGWAPLPPPNFYWPDPWIYYDYDVWVVVHIDDFCDDRIAHHVIDQPRELLRRDIAVENKELLRRDIDVKQPPEIKQVKRLAGREIPVNTIGKRSLDIRTDRIKAAVKSTIQRTVQKQEASASKEIARIERKNVVTRQNDQAEQKTAATREPAQVERKPPKRGSPHRSSARSSPPRKAPSGPSRKR